MNKEEYNGKHVVTVQRPNKDVSEYEYLKFYGYTNPVAVGKSTYEVDKIGIDISTITVQPRIPKHDLPEVEILRTIVNTNGKLYDVLAETKKDYTLVRDCATKEHVVAWKLREYKDGHEWGQGLYCGNDYEAAKKLYDEKAGKSHVVKKGKSR